MCLSVRRVHVYLWEAVHVVKMSRSRPTSSDRRRPGWCRSARTESQCRARFGFCEGESTASRLSLMAGVAQGRDRGAIPRGRVMMMSAGVAGLAVQLHILHTRKKCRRHAPCTLFQNIAAGNTSATRPEPHFRQGDRTQSHARCGLRCLEAVNGLGVREGGGRCIATTIGNRRRLSLP